MLSSSSAWSKTYLFLLSFDSTPVRIITILPMTLLMTDSSVIPSQFLHSLRLPFFGSLTSTESFSPFSWCLLFSPHYVHDLLDFSGSKLMPTLSSSACMFSIPGAFPFFRCPTAFLTSALLGSDVSSVSSISISLTGLLGFYLFSTSVKCSNHRLVLTFFITCVKLLPGALCHWCSFEL